MGWLDLFCCASPGRLKRLQSFCGSSHLCTFYWRNRAAQRASEAEPCWSKVHALVATGRHVRSMCQPALVLK